MAELERLQTREIGDVTVAIFKDARILEDLRIQELGAELFELVEGEGRNKLVLNFAAVEFLSSAALSKLIVLDKKIKANSGSLKLCCVRPEILEIFSMTQLDKYFDIRDSEVDALAEM